MNTDFAALSDVFPWQSPRQDTSDALREKELMLTNAQRLARLGCWAWNVADDRLTWSDQTHHILGIGLDAFDGTLEGFLALVHPEDRQALRDSVRQALRGLPRFDYRYRLRGRDGVERLIEGTVEGQVGGDGALHRLLGTVKDITRLERDRQALHDSEQRFRSLVALSSDWYWQQDAELRFTEISGSNHPFLAHRQHLIGMHAWDMEGCTLLDTTWEDHRRVLAARQPFRDLQLRCRIGSLERDLTISGEPFHDVDGRFLGYRGVGSDITERKAAEDHRSQVNASLRMAMRLGRIGVWSLEAEHGALRWWDGGRVVYGVDGAVATDLEQLLRRVDPAHRPPLRAAVQRCIEHGEAFDLEVPLQEGIQPLMWARLIGEPHRDDRGRIRRVQGTVQDVTERRLAAERARELGTRLADTLDEASHAFLTLNREGAITYLNQQAERLLRHPGRKLLGQSLWDAFPDLRATRLQREFSRAMAEGETVEFEEFLEHLRIWLQVRAHPSPQGLAIYFRDITDSHSVQQALADSQEQLRNLFENTIDGVLYTAEDDRIVRVNPAACAVLGRAPAQLRGRRFAELVRPDDPRLPSLAAQRGMTGRASGQLTLLHADGSEIPVEVSSAEYTAADGSLRAFVVFRDISRRVRAETGLIRLAAELGDRVRRRTAELEAANAELKAFAHALAHDLRSPLAAIDGFSDLLEHELPQPAPGRAAHFLARIRAAARESSDYAQGLLELAHVAQVTLEPGRVDLSALATDLLTQLAERDRERAVEWQVQEGLVAGGDARLLRMLLENLLGNAWKFTRDRAPARIDFAACAVDGETVYRVRDNGAGFDMAQAHRLFGQFQRLHSHDEFPGTGVGLANVQRVVARHGGRVWAEAVPGEGAAFYFTLAAGSSVK